MLRHFTMKTEPKRAGRGNQANVPEPIMPVPEDFLEPTLPHGRPIVSRKEYALFRAASEPVRNLETYIDGPGAAFLRALVRMAPVAPIEIETDEATIMIEVKPNTASE